MTSLSLVESRQRAALLRPTSYDVRLDLTDAETFGSHSTIRFTAREPGAETFVEIADALSVRATLNGAELPSTAWSSGRITLTDLAEHNELVVEARLPYVTDGDGMHTFTDPADGERYVSAYCGMDIAKKVFACFDQPDLKAPITLEVRGEEHWTVLANGVVTFADAGTWTFATTPPISTYLFVVCAGPWHSVAFEHRGLPFGWHARQSLAADLERQAGELRAITTDCFDHYTRVFEEPYPFDSYDQVMAPGQNWGALETPGCVTFRDELLFRGEPSAAQRQQRAMTIAHEMAHMWFGDLVTMKWWEDSWLNESFADYMGYQVAAEAAGFTDSWIACAQTRKPMGFRADERRSTHPVAEETEAMVDVDTAFGNFDMITYAKGNAVLRQLVAWLGTETFHAGVNAHLGAHRFGNAELDDFLAALDSVSDRDVRGWARAWLGTTGFDTIRVERVDGVPVLHREGVRPHRFTVNGYDENGALVADQLVDLADGPLALPALRDLPVVVNAGDETFARVHLDEQSNAFVDTRLGQLDDPLVRAVLWRGLVDQTRTGIRSVDELLRLVARHLPTERHPLVFEGALNAVHVFVGQRLVDPTRLPHAHDVLATTCSLARHHHRVAATRVLVETTSDRELLEHWLTDGQTDLGDPLDQDQRWAVVRRLVALGADPGIIDAESGRDNSAAGRLATLRCRATVPSPEAKAAAWSLAFDGEPSNREFTAIVSGFWTVGQHDLLASYLPRFLTEAPAIAQRHGQAFSKVVGQSFPHLPWPLEVLESARSDLAARLADSGLAAGGLPTVLEREWNDLLDELDVTLRVRRRPA
ncbi:aminopeptidase N [Nocardioides jensenii]|uniref:aminopeptidase N n=1 Tax=Nocardioides jensenii TaxID=1843 RepID=UPI00082FF1EF|nr:aminopeptidase N [Nocardioides jensenii]